MLIDVATGLIQGARFQLSPNHDARPDPDDINLLVIHGISLPPGQYGSSHVIDFFMNQLQIGDHPYFASISDLKVSTHCFIRRSGDLWQFVPLHQRAWHAGLSLYEGRERCNDFSIAIELEGTDDEPYTVDQYNTLLQLSSALMQHYPLITPDRIVGHSDIAPGRKSDPGPYFNWQQFREAVNNI